MAREIEVLNPVKIPIEIHVRHCQCGRRWTGPGTKEGEYLIDPECVTAHNIVTKWIQLTHTPRPVTTGNPADKNKLGYQPP